MTQLAHSEGTAAHNEPDAINRRIVRTMVFVVLVAATVSLFVTTLQVTSGILLGGALSLLNFSWMRGSLAAAFSVAYSGQKPQIKIVQYVLRYLVIAVAVIVTYKLKLASLPAMIFGLCSFVPALMVEAVREFYFAIIRREEVG
jgi:hypothetical protein